jgi:hypothetical protein
MTTVKGVPETDIADVLSPLHALSPEEKYKYSTATSTLPYPATLFLYILQF